MQGRSVWAIYYRELRLCTPSEYRVPNALDKPVIPPWKPAKSSKVGSEDEWYYTDDHTDGEFFDLVENPERYTGYSGRSAARQWSAIHEGTGFGLKEYTDAAGAGYTLSSLPDDRGNDFTGECAEKRVYHKILSGESRITRESPRIFRKFCRSARFHLNKSLPQQSARCKLGSICTCPCVCLPTGHSLISTHRHLIFNASPIVSQCAHNERKTCTLMRNLCCRLSLALGHR
jgi:hypothetical protein